MSENMGNEEEKDTKSHGESKTSRRELEIWRPQLAPPEQPKKKLTDKILTATRIE